MTQKTFKDLWTPNSEYIDLIMSYFPEKYSILKKYLFEYSGKISEIKYKSCYTNILLNHRISLDPDILSIIKYENFVISNENVLRVLQTEDRMLLDYAMCYCINNKNMPMIRALLNATTNKFRTYYFCKNYNILVEDKDFYELYKHRFSIRILLICAGFNDSYIHAFPDYFDHRISIDKGVGPNYIKYSLQRYDKERNIYQKEIYKKFIKNQYEQILFSDISLDLKAEYAKLYPRDMVYDICYKAVFTILYRIEVYYILDAIPKRHIHKRHYEYACLMYSMKRVNKDVCNTFLNIVYENRRSKKMRESGE